MRGPAIPAHLGIKLGCEPYLPEGHYETDRRLSDFDNLIPALVGTIPNKRQLSSAFHGMAAHCNGSL
jgi:hypothetical protein